MATTRFPDAPGRIARLPAGLPTLRQSAEAQGRAAAFERRLRWVQSWIPVD